MTRMIVALAAAAMRLAAASVKANTDRMTKAFRASATPLMEQLSRRAKARLKAELFE